MIRESMRDLGLLFLRVAMGIMYLYHGIPKLMGGPSLWGKLGGAVNYVGIDFAPVTFGLAAALSETVGAVCLMLGIFFRPALSLLIVTMVVAASMHLGRGDGLKVASHAIENAIVFFSLLLIGPGKHKVLGN